MNNNSNPQWWLKSSTFVITNTLHAYIQAHAIPDQESEYLCYIQNKVIVGSDRAETDDYGFLRVSKNVWRNKCGMNYTQWLDLLTRIGEIEVDNSYHFLPANATPDQQDNFIPKCKGFKVPYEKLASGLVKVDFKKKHVLPLKRQAMAGCYTNDPHIYYLMACLGEVRVVDEPVFPNDPLRYAMSKQYLEKTHCKAFGLHRAKSGRVFHSIIESPRESRVNLRHSSGESLVDIDVKTCHPHLLLPLFSDPEEKQSFYADLQGDLYTRINPEDDRASVKRRVCQYLMAKNREAEWLTGTDVHSYFTKNFPIFWKEKLSQDSGLAFYLQGEESQIVTRELVAYCQANHYFIVTMHDGCLTRQCFKDAIMDELKRLLREHTGYAVGVEEKSSLSTMDKLVKGGGTLLPAKSVLSTMDKTNILPTIGKRFDYASIDLAFDMEVAMDAFKRQYEPLQKRANREARLNYSPNIKTKYWKVWRECHKAMDVLIDEYQEPIRYFAEKPKTKRKYRL